MSSGFRDLIKNTQRLQKRADFNINEGAAILGQAIVSSSSRCVRPPRRDISSHHLTSRAWIIAAQLSWICNFPLTTAFSSLVLMICLAQGERETSKMSPPSPGFASLLLSTGNYQSYLVVPAGFGFISSWMCSCHHLNKYCWK